VRRVRILGGILVAGAVLFPASASPRATVLSSTVKLALPAADTGAVYEVDVTLKLPAGVHLTGVSGQPFQLQATNQSSVPSYIRSAARIVKTSSLTSYKVFIAVNAPKGKVPFRTLADDKTLDIVVNAPPPYVKVDAKAQPGDKCSDLIAKANKGLADVVIVGASPTEGPTIEKFTEGADPHCKKPPPTTTTSKPGHCDATPLPKDCRFDLSVDVSMPDDVRGAKTQSIPAKITVTNEGPAGAGPSYLVIVWNLPHASKAVDFDTLPGCDRPTLTQQICDVPPLGKGESKTFEAKARVNNANEEIKDQRKTEPRLEFLVFAQAGTLKNLGDPCEPSLEVTCANNSGRQTAILEPPPR